MRKFLEGSEAIAEIIKLCKPAVISAYPITPQTHIVENLATMVSNGELSAQFVNVESEHSAASVVLGSSATGVRVYTATSSQGLFLMAEVVFNIAGMRLPVVMTCANRAISGPINIWNDQQDSISLRDSGWLQLFAENLQEAVDFHLLAYKIAEDKKFMLPVMVCMDGFILTHGVETVDIPSETDVNKFLPVYDAPYKLDINKPLSLGCLADPDYYMETRFAIQKTFDEILDEMPKITKEFEDIFGRSYGNLIEEYKTKDADKVIVALGSVCGTIKDVVDEARKKGQKWGVLKIMSYRPFPKELIFKALRDIPRVAVVDKAVSLGSLAPLYSEIKALFANRKKSPKTISSFILGLGGRDISKDSIKEIFRKLSVKELDGEFIDLKPELLTGGAL
ncbi:MAG: pyruvate ferredoxin oxidoreductase [Candidatus Omnitrophota bacterium]